MHASVNEVFISFSEEFEGHVQYMYLDILGLVTCGVGNLIDPVSEAVKLPWKRADGALATRDQVESEWQAIKARQDLKRRHYRFAATVTTVRLYDSDIATLVRARLRGNEAFLRGYFPEWDLYPADAQLGISSMAWACGAGFPEKFPNFTREARAQNWLAAREHCSIRTEGNPGVIPRNLANRVCFANAAEVLSQGLERSCLYWPDKPPPKRSVSQTFERPPFFAPDPNLAAVHAARDSEIRELNENTPTTAPDIPSLKKR